MTHTQELHDVACSLIAHGKGILAIDESTRTCNKRFATAGIAQTYENRCAYRELLVTTPALSESISGAILYDETIRQVSKDGTPFVEILHRAGILPGIKVDTGAKALANHPGEKITEGLDGLRARLEEYFHMGARFAKWRAVFGIAECLPSRSCIDANAQALARYAALCQEAGIVPIVEPEVLMSGAHTMERCAEVTQTVLHSVFHQLSEQHVMLEGMILKPNMVLPGAAATNQETVDVVTHATIDCLRQVIPAAVPGIAFLSGGQSGELASARLNAINAQAATPSAREPWSLTFSFGRALQFPALAIWHGDEVNTVAAQHALIHRAHCNHAALLGKYRAAMEQQAAPVSV